MNILLDSRRNRLISYRKSGLLTMSRNGWVATGKSKRNMSSYNTFFWSSTDSVRDVPRSSLQHLTGLLKIRRGPDMMKNTGWRLRSDVWFLVKYQPRSKIWVLHISQHWHRVEKIYEWREGGREERKERKREWGEPERFGLAAAWIINFPRNDQECH